MRDVERRSAGTYLSLLARQSEGSCLESSGGMTARQSVSRLARTTRADR